MQRRGALWLMNLHADLVPGAVLAMGEGAVCGPVSSFLTTLLRRLHSELQASGGLLSPCPCLCNAGEQGLIGSQLL